MTTRRGRRGRYGKPKHLVRNIIIGLAASLVTLTGIGVTAPDDEYDWSQDAFPCHEDEVLGYAPEFGPDHVGCIHIDELR